MEQQLEQHPVFKKYTRDWLHDVTGYSKPYLCRVANGRVPLTSAFIDRLSFKLGEPADQLFNLEPAGAASVNPSSN